jgi:pimeloyl-ACP methyl ester carboxylesterase
MILTRSVSLLALLALLVGGASANAQQIPEGWRDGYVVANGIRIHYWRTGAPGDRPPLVLAHGSSDDALVWVPLAKQFQDRYDVIMFDARGHGLSDPPTRADAADVQVEDLGGLIRELGLQRPILMGHSMGSASVAHFAANYPDVPRAVILEDPNFGQPAGAAPTAPAGAPGATQAPVEQRRAALLARNNLSQEELVAECMRNSPRWGREECEYWAPSKRRHHPFTIRDVPASRPPMSELFTRILAPTLILKADAQGELRRHNESVAATLRNGRIVHVTGAGHNVRREGKEQTIETLREFLAELR